jgi:hypothetical protein
VIVLGQFICVHVAETFVDEESEKFTKMECARIIPAFDGFLAWGSTARTLSIT